MAYTENKRIDGLTLAARSALMKLVCQVNGETDAKYILIESIYELIVNLTEKTTSFQPTTDELRVYDSTTAEERSLPINSLFNNYLISGIYQQQLRNSTNKNYGELFLQKIGNIVVGQYLMESSITTGDSITPAAEMFELGGVTLITIPPELAPLQEAGTDEGIAYSHFGIDYAAGIDESNGIGLVLDGADWRVKLGLKNITGSFISRNWGFSYIAANSTIYTP